ncbi:Leukotriene B4 receptor 1 [Acipenser ruthenus]|uniref:Leukotriene B4 receptor 1 n=1 Tax=Acipenser ruthenus TaxID=7906 RepID=A0A444UCX4_ACIRT|nr:Leukotriene B4 receptor 1 [Acipenser ruthenus]
MVLYNDTLDLNQTSWLGDSLAPSLVLGTCFLVGVPGNSVVIWAILSQVRRLTFTMKLMLNLAVTDILTLVTLPLWIYALADTWLYGIACCKFFCYLIYCSMYASVFSVMMMSVHRYMVVLYPLCKQKLRGRKSDRTLLSLVWVLAGLFAIPVLGIRKVEDRNGRQKCLATGYTSHNQKAAFLMLETLVGFVIPCMTLAVSYFFISKRMKQTSFQAGRRLGKLITSIVFSFFILWFPYHVFNILTISTSLLKANSQLENSARLESFSETGTNLAGALSFINSCINPILYAFASRSLRRGIRTSTLVRQLEQVCHSHMDKARDTLTMDSTRNVPNRQGSMCTPQLDYDQKGSHRQVKPMCVEFKQKYKK